jgi:prepilin-type N-terminal cleavage/methylation domain-containing protein
MGGNKASGFSLVETLIALTLVGVAMTGLLVAFVGSGKLGVLARRQANAVAVGRSIASQLDVAPWGDPRLANTNSGNDVEFADPNGRFALPTVPTGAFAPDSVLGVYTGVPATDTSFKVGDESYDAYVNVAPDGTTGIFFAVIVRYRVGNQGGGTFMRAVVLGYRYNPAVGGTRQLPI